MSKIPESEINRIKATTDIVALIQSRGVKLKKQGTNWIGFCPFHNDTETPNLIVTPSKGLFRCMADGCGKTGNVIQFVQWFDGLSFRHAFELLANGGQAAFEAPPKATSKKSTTARLPCPLDPQGEDHKLLNQVIDFYHTRLTTQGTPGLDYLKSRGLDDQHLITKFKIGLSDRTLGLRIPHGRTKDGKELRQKLQSLGVYRENGREHLNGCLTTPIFNLEGQPTQIYGRRIDPKVPKELRHLYLPKSLTGIFNPEALKNREIILTESIIDALTFYRHGMEAVTCTYGTKNFTDELFEAINEAKIESVRLAFDADESGEHATAKALEKLTSYGIECHQIKLPWGSDANSYALDQGPEALRQAVRNAHWLGASSHTTSQNSENSHNHSTSTVASSLAANLAAEVAKKENFPKPENSLQRLGEHHQMTFGERLYRVDGLDKNNSLGVLKITLRVTHEGLLHVDSLDLYRDGERRKFIERAAEETLLEKDLLKRDLGKLLLALEQTQEERLNGDPEEETPIELTPEERHQALDFLQKPKLLDRISKAYDEAGIAGEKTNLLAAYLACASRKLHKPLAVIIQSTSAAGKSTLMEAVLSFFPEEDQIKYSAMTGQSLYYLGEKNLKHKILAIVEEEGAEKASYALKLLQSEGELTIASTGKDNHSGRMETQEYHVEGPVSIILTTTSIDIDEELLNRCLVLTVDESKTQTELIHQLQREARTIEGIIASEKRKDIQHLLKNAQRLLHPMQIANPYAPHLTFTANRTRTRRDHEKYLTLIESIALLHQHQRTTITRTINGREIQMLPVTLEDIEAANQIAPEVLGRSLDELPPQTRRLLESIKALVRQKMVEKSLDQNISLFSRRELRDFTGWSHMQIRRHLERLLELEYIAIRGGRNGLTLKHELLIDAHETGETYTVGLLDVSELRELEKKQQLKKKKTDPDTDEAA